MPLFCKMEWNEQRQRHEMQILNQQADWIMRVDWDPDRGDYFWDCGPEEAQTRGVANQGAKFDAVAELDAIRERLRLANVGGGGDPND